MDDDVRADPDRSRYEITADGEPAGFTQYRLANGVAHFLHTEVDDRFAGRGLATRLIRFALDDAREHGWQVLPHCPFVRGFIAKHAEYVDLVPEQRRAEFDLDAR